MKEENQNIEWKETWRDEFLKWICGFANAQGGKIYIGINDKGVVSGLSETKRLLEDIPNKTKDTMGILVDVNLKKKTGKSYIEIVVEAYPNPISYKGEYHYRTGSTKQVLVGNALTKFLLQRQGKRRDGVPMPHVTLKALDSATFIYFRKKAKETARLTTEALTGGNEILLENLRLKADGDFIKRAAVLLFHKDPEKYVTGAYIKIGFFNSDTDLAYQDEVHGNLFQQVEKTMDLLLTKYMKAFISYEGIHRIEKYQVPEIALREALLNAIAHKDYSSGNPIQISVYKGKIIIWNDGELPPDWTIRNLKAKHPSKPFNPDIANAFFRAGLIEAWGRGTLKIINECKEHGIKIPVFKYSLSGFVIEFNFNAIENTLTPKELVERSIEDLVLNILGKNNNATITELVSLTDKSKSTIQRVIDRLKEEKKILREGSKKQGSWKVLK